MIKFIKEPDYDVNNPERDFGNAGIDFYIPKYSKTFEKAFIDKNTGINSAILDTNKTAIIIRPHGDAIIPSGIHSFMSSDIGLIAVNKSGIASKNKLVVGACLVDPNYKGIIHCHVINTSDEVVCLKLGQKIVQFVPYKFDNSQVEIVENQTVDEFYSEMSFNNRGTGAFGSTGI